MTGVGRRTGCAVPTPERAQWAVERLGVTSGARVLEVGCGHGHAAALICELVGESGSLTAVDRSTLMMDAAGGRLAAWAASGRVHLICGGIEDSVVPDGSFDIAFGFSVAPMWRSPDVTAAVWRALRPGGALHLFDQPPGWKHAADVDAYATPVLAALQGYGFETFAPDSAHLSAGWAVHIRAARPATEGLGAVG
jgi:ubiquinone/menaquinone biosynthesis C-methylase UbiE